jgi:hypothetical protein
MDWAQAAEVGTVAAAVVALGTLLRGGYEYTKQGALRRAEQFTSLRVRFKENESFRTLCAMLDEDDEQLADAEYKDRRDLLGFFEEIALMTNSRLLRPAVAHYMFGYYAIRCWESDAFWHEINRESDYWRLFRDFVDQMMEREQSFRYKRRGFRF